MIYLVVPLFQRAQWKYQHACKDMFFGKSCTDEVTISDHHHLLKASLETEFIKRNKEEIFYRRYKSADI